MRKRTFFLGLGTGILFATFVIHLAWGEKFSPVLSESDVQQWLNDHAYVMVREKDWEEAQEAKEPSQEPSPTVRTEQKTAIYIVPGMGSQTVGQLLEDVRLIRDGQAFNQRVKDQQLENRIRAGYHVFEDDPTLDEIIDMITK